MNLAYPLILGSKSPRRKEILQKAGFQFTAEAKDTEESYAEDLPKEEVAAYLAEKKAQAFQKENKYANSIVLTADTTVLIDEQLLEKPADANEAFQMLKKLSGRKHKVISAFAILYKNTIKSYSDETIVYFSEMDHDVINSYIDQHQPFDKAGAYGIQEGLGLTHIDRLEGSYFTVMGLPIHLVYKVLSTLPK